MQFIIICIDTETITRVYSQLDMQWDQIKEALLQMEKSLQDFIECAAEVFASIGNAENDSPEERSTKKFCFLKVHLRQILPHRLPWYTSGFT